MYAETTAIAPGSWFPGRNAAAETEEQPMAGPTSAQLSGRAQRSAEAAGAATFAAWVFAVVAIAGALFRMGRSDLDVGGALVALSWVLVFGGVAAAFGLLATLLSGQSLILRALANAGREASSDSGPASP